MKKLLAILALAVLLVPGIVLAQPPGCTWNGDPCIRLGWSGVTQPGIDYRNILPGQTLNFTIRVQNAYAMDPPFVGGWPLSCNTACDVLDTFCTEYSVRQGATVTCLEGFDVPYELPSCYAYDHHIGVKAAGGCNAVVGSKDTIIVRMVYAKGEPAEDCAPECGDCVNPNYRSYVRMYNADTLIITVVAAPPALGVLQDTLTLVDRGQTQAFIPFTICNQDDCAPPTLYSYNIKSKGVAGRISAINQSGSATVSGGACKDVYGIIDAGIAFACDYDTLTIIVWTPAPVIYDTCVQVIHIIEPEPVPLFTVPVVTILVLALILAAAVFMRRRAVSRA